MPSVGVRKKSQHKRVTPSLVHPSFRIPLASFLTFSDGKFRAVGSPFLPHPHSSSLSLSEFPYILSEAWQSGPNFRGRRVSSGSAGEAIVLRFGFGICKVKMVYYYGEA
ncbi:hypothetical protein Nepgr_011122 [Nepenthes gracilis]|uniref:Uncharacterized protein n=1 Tax=Nepenthes gracilis TaxID=150966 RepID=A0AAD3SEJ0_NEPGR|nr:hypothetical protein Nepgr_011122 [Nepenthes gracilis]